MISKTPFIVVDCETTGLVPNLDKIIELAAVKVIDGRIVDEFYTLINPGIFVPLETTNITGINSDMLVGAPDFNQIGAKFMEFMGGEDSVFVAHNVDFDRAFVNKALSGVSKDIEKNPYLCTIDFTRYLHPNLSKYNLGALANTFAIDMPQAHRAIHDARATAHLLIKLLRLLQSGGAKALADIPVIDNLPKKEKTTVSENQKSLF